MKAILRSGFLVLVLMLAPACSENAGPYENGVAAYQRGDYASALKFWRPLAAQGNAYAQYNLGFMYDEGRGVPQDFVQAHMWFELAAAQGHEEAPKGRDLVASQMTPDQNVEAQRMAREWMAKHQQ